jgi:hypothetical protein
VNAPTTLAIANSLAPGGLLLASRTGSGSITGYINSTTASASIASSTVPTEDIYFLAQNAVSGASGFSSNTFKFAFIGGGLTPTQVAALASAVTTFQTALSRN